MPITRRYTPEHPPGEQCLFGYDYSPIIPVGVGISSGTVAVLTNTAVPVAAPEWVVGPVIVRGRAIYASLTGGNLGADYQIHWVATDTDGNVWPRVGVVLCGFTS
jgi:hypothetical protein